MKAVYSDRNRDACADAYVEQWCQSLLSSNSPWTYFATGTQFDRLRVALVEGDISELTLSINGDEIKVNQHGRLERWPDELEVSSRLLMTLIDIQVAR